MTVSPSLQIPPCASHFIFYFAKSKIQVKLLCLSPVACEMDSSFFAPQALPWVFLSSRCFQSPVTLKNLLDFSQSGCYLHPFQI